MPQTTKVQQTCFSLLVMEKTAFATRPKWIAFDCDTYLWLMILATNLEFKQPSLNVCYKNLHAFIYGTYSTFCILLLCKHTQQSSFSLKPH